VRNIVFRYQDSPTFARALREGDLDLVVPDGEAVGDGEWVLAIFEVPGEDRSTAAAARGLHRGGGAGQVLAFERRDWERLIRFARAGAKPAAKAPPAPARFPAEAPTQRSVLRETPSQRPSDPFVQRPNARLLLVDDDRDIREVVAAILEAVGLVVEAVTSAEEALERVRADSYDVVVLDWNLPGMTGIELCREIRSDPVLSTLPVLFLTAHASSHDVVDAFASGADDYVVKPFRAPELGARIFGLLRRARMLQPSS
jgi:two-component system phosphate regulon response regulator PhoB